MAACRWKHKTQYMYATKRLKRGTKLAEYNYQQEMFKWPKPYIGTVLIGCLRSVLRWMTSLTVFVAHLY